MICPKWENTHHAIHLCHMACVSQCVQSMQLGKKSSTTVKQREVVTHQLWVGVGLPQWGRAGRGPKVLAYWCAPPPPQWGGGGGDGDVAEYGDDDDAGRDDGDERDEWHQHELQPLPPGDALHQLLPAFTTHAKDIDHTSNDNTLNTYNPHTETIHSVLHTKCMRPADLPPGLQPSLYCHEELRSPLWRAAVPLGAQRAPLAVGETEEVNDKT